MKEFLEAGKICNTHGLKGHLKIMPWTDSPYVYEDFEFLYIDNKEYCIEELRYQKNFVILKLKGIDDATKASEYKEKTVFCDKRDIGALNDDTYFVADLISCEIVEDGVVLGSVIDVINNGAADLYEIRQPDNTFFYLPAIKENILKVDIQNKIINVKLPKGLLE